MKKETRDALVAALAAEIKDSVMETISPKIDQVLNRVEDLLKTTEEEPVISEPQEIFGVLTACLYKPEDETWWELNVCMNDDTILNIDEAATKEELIENWGLVVNDKDTE